MEYSFIKNTDLKVSKICLGTMTFGEQNSEQEGHDQMDYALNAGVNFLDTAEMYSIPPRKETQGSTERIIGSWMQKRKNRDQVVIASKVTGPSPAMRHIRDPLNFSEGQIFEALEGNLQRLKTDYIDIYQLHWPERRTNFFGKLGYEHRNDDPWVDNFAEIVQAMDKARKQGKIRYWGISNETAWGAMHFFKMADQLRLSRPVTIQNVYNLLNRSYEVGLAEVSMREGVGLLAYSPLAMGMLSGKYIGGKKPENARLTLFKQYKRYSNENASLATEEYVRLAEKYRISPTQLALAYVNSRPFLSSNIIGATSIEQLKENIGSIEVKLSEELIKELDRIHEKYTYPSP